MKKFLTKILAITLALILLILGAGCEKKSSKKNRNDDSPKRPTVAASQETSDSNSENPEALEDFKVGFIFLYDEYSTYDNNFITAAQTTCSELGVEYAIKKNIPESAACQQAAEDLVEMGCDVIFADSFGHEDYMIQVAKNNPDVQFCTASGTKAHTEGLDNYSNAYASIHEGRYLTGVAAGMKLNEMISDGLITADQAKMGFVGAFSYAEVISSYTAFYLGAKSVCPTVTMEVMFTGAWYDEAMEKEAATALISNGCVLISQYADSMGAPAACEAAGIPNVAYGSSTQASCPNTFIISSRIDWTPYFKYMIECAKEGKNIDTDWTGTLETGSVVLTDVNTDVAAEGTVEKLEEVKNDLISGEIKVFDISTFTANGSVVTYHYADVDTDETFTADTQVILSGCFNESVYRSAPYFDLRIDGITLLNESY